MIHLITPTGQRLDYDAALASAARRERAKHIPSQVKSAATRKANMRALQEDRLAALRGAAR